MKEFIKRNQPLLIFITFLVLIFLARVVLFAGKFGGVEHDSGWYLGVARNLAERGIYASYTNTIGSEEKGANPSLHGRFSVQDEQGFSYFPAGVTVGPGYIIPEAFLLKIFGYGWWQYRLWPLLGYTFLLFILFYITMRLGNILSVILLAIWIWAVPQATTGYAFESYSEHIALLYLLISFFLCAFFIQSHPRQKKYIFLSGLFFSFSFLTKNISFLSIPSFFCIALFDIWNNRKKIKTSLFHWVLFVCGVLLPIGIFEAYQYLYLVSRFGNEGYHGVKEDFRLHFKSNGSGITNLDISHLDWAFINKKFNVWKNIGISQPFIVWILLLLSPFLLFMYIKKNYRVLFTLMYISSLSIFLWYVLVSPAGWARHAWAALFEGMVILSVSIGHLFAKILKQKKKNFYFGLILLAGIFWLIRFQSITVTPFLTDQTVQKWKTERFITGVEGFPSTPTLSLQDQQGVVSFFKNHIKEKDRIYYLGWFIHAEVPPLVDKVFYTVDRYFTLSQTNPARGKSYLIFGPYQQGPWSFEPPQYVQTRVEEYCTNVVYKNPSYLLCTLRSGLVYNNPAY